MSKIYAAIDLGASSGRVIVSYLDEEIINSKEIHRFKNGAKEKNGRLCWDIEYVFENILLGLEKCKTQGYIPNYIGIDTWGVDFALVGKNGEDNSVANQKYIEAARALYALSYVSETYKATING